MEEQIEENAIREIMKCFYRAYKHFYCQQPRLSAWTGMLRSFRDFGKKTTQYVYKCLPSLSGEDAAVKKVGQGWLVNEFVECGEKRLTLRMRNERNTAARHPSTTPKATGCGHKK